jgi:DNA-directed RNA polymerase subunit RPC12/RpoP
MLIEDVTDPLPMRQRSPLSEYDSEVAQYWCYEKNCGFGPEDFSHGSNVKVWWYCVLYKHHVFQQAIKDRVRWHGSTAHGCPFCASKIVTDENSLQFCAPAVAAQWHPSKNGTLRPSEVTSLSGLKAWWLCPECKRGWQAVIESRVGLGRGRNCPYCANKRWRLLTTYASCFRKSHANGIRKKTRV